MPRPMRVFTVSDTEKRATLLLSNWRAEVVNGRERWWPPGMTGGLGVALETAYRQWRAG